MLMIAVSYSWEMMETFMEETLREGFTTFIVLIIRKASCLYVEQALSVVLSTQCRMCQILGEEK